MKKILKPAVLIAICATLFGIISWWNSPEAQLSRLGDWLGKNPPGIDVEAGVKAFDRTLNQANDTFWKRMDEKRLEWRARAHRNKVNELIGEGYTPQEAENLAIPSLND